jgi:hypothetical protein
VFPADPANPTGPGIVTGLDPDTIDPGYVGDDEIPPPDAPPDEEAEPEPPLNSQWQNTRLVRLSNATKKRVKLFITYETLNAAEEVVEDNVEVTADPDEVFDLEQGGWIANAIRIKIVIRYPDGTEVKRFKDEWLDLVPETDQDGVPGYASPSVQRVTIAIR